MALNKRTYVDQETVITAQNLNDIQDEIIANGTAIAGKIGTAEKGASGGVAELDQTGKVPSSQLPSYVDDVVEYDSLSEFPATGEAGKIYVAKDTNKTYRWGGSDYVEISESLALGETSTTAYRGDRGKAAYDDSQTNKTNIGTMSSLTTTEKGTLVGAINEVNSGKVDKVTGKGLSTEDYTTAEKTKLSGVQAEATKTVIDNTLANAGQAADAKKTGDEISGLKNTLSQLETTTAQLDQNIAYVESGNTASRPYTYGQFISWKGTLYTVSDTNGIASGVSFSNSNLAAVVDGDGDLCGGFNAITNQYKPVNISNSITWDITPEAGLSYVYKIDRLIIMSIMITTPSTVTSDRLIATLPYTVGGVFASAIYTAWSGAVAGLVRAYQNRVYLVSNEWQPSKRVSVNIAFIID